MSWSLLPYSNQQRAKINTCILAVVTREAFLLYSAVGNVVICGIVCLFALRGSYQKPFASPIRREFYVELNWSALQLQVLPFRSLQLYVPPWSKAWY